MSPTRPNVPWPELSALGALMVAVVAWSAGGRGVDARGAAVALLAVVVALSPRRLERDGHGGRAEAIAVAAALGAVSIATTAGGFDAPSRVVRIAHAIASGELLGFSTMLALAQPMRTDSLRRAALPALFVAALGTCGFWPQSAGWFPGARVLGPAASAIAVLLHVAALQRPTNPALRARWTYPTLGVGVLAVATVLRGAALDGAVLAWSVGVAAHVLGLVVGHRESSAATSAGFARRVLVGVLGLFAGVAALAMAPSAPGLALLAGLAVSGLAYPAIERLARPARGRLLDACVRIENALARAEGLDELAAAVLDPLREAARNLRAPAALWVLEGERTIRVDVAGTATVGPLVLEAEKALVTWLRTVPSVVFADTLRPHLVRRPELRSVAEALDAHSAFAAIPLSDHEDLLGAVIVPRGDRSAPPSYEEEVALERLRGAVEGALLRILAAERSLKRTAEARAAADANLSRAETAEAEVARIAGLAVESASIAALGASSVAWVGYSDVMRELGDRIDVIARTPGPVAFVVPPFATALPAAARLHAAGRRRGRGLLVLDAASGDACVGVAALVGDSRGAPVPGWIERAAGGTLLVEDAMALGHDGLTALSSAIASGRARRIGAERGYDVDIDVVVTLPRPPSECDLPPALRAALVDRWTEIPPLRMRSEDVESLALAAVDRACRRQDRRPVGIAPDAIAALRTYPWPGEIAELETAMSMAVGAARGSRIHFDDLPAAVRATVFRVSRDEHGARLDD